jgi:hypothetical protein
MSGEITSRERRCAVSAMKADELLSRLEGLAEQLRIPVRYAALDTEEFSGRGGLCVLRGERRIIIERTLGYREKARLLAMGLAQFDLDAVFVLPAVRQAIEQAKAGGGVLPS